ncbi:SUMF1/EgtB/PvdO family nonheme iron enzyme [Chitinophaga sp. SYP-B3965]|uniref:SUMF1/EgtB/PvdO family nonheme iron enzyme n=1 Tax=Chitinophaga sp. SYP-B3965 TaxID=2663120 RepID=UPI0012999DF8|nr:SUMF1/EgtB/PvdO family nonheme iron enzyme [Chitinophaga sp. SYP-B3965]MRG48363.1 SUMF1/EgtB/PvdO family nonheme iron enzyme [Chitinophaga sp. SYP-B3965]
MIYALLLFAYINIPAGTYTVGEKGHVRKVHITGFKIANTELTNASFEKFVLATGYVTDAEKFKNAMVFVPGLAEFRWLEDSTAYWRYPNGVSRGGIEQKMDHPVTTISYHDAQAYCAWAKVRLPTLDEWEIASRVGNTFPGNIWHGRDHLQADNSDGFMYTSPVGSFQPNAIGLYDLFGNVFEFCSGALPGDGKNVVHARGGSWWCSKNACSFFNATDIGRVQMRASFSNQGFRVVKR